VTRDCDQCGVAYEAKRPSSKFCSARCRNRAARARAVTVADAAPLGSTAELLMSMESVFASTRAELLEAKAVKSSAGQAALKLALLIDLATPLGASAVSGMVKELRATMAEAVRSKPSATSLVDELRLRREQRANAS